VEQITIEKLPGMTGDTLATTVEPDGPAYCHVDKYELEAGNFVHRGIIYTLPLRDLPIPTQKSARSAL
jgi:hypothetical protein